MWKGRKFTCVIWQWGFCKCFILSSRQIQYSRIIQLNSACIANVFVPKVESGEQADVPKVESGEQANVPKVELGKERVKDCSEACQILKEILSQCFKCSKASRNQGNTIYKWLVHNFGSSFYQTEKLRRKPNKGIMHLWFRDLWKNQQ